jgi:NAD-dependent SIR2 family protein deacetylase
MIAIGTTLAVYPVAAVVPAAQRAGAKIAIINAEPTEMDHLADLVIRESISDVLSIAVSGVPNLPVETNEEEARDEKQS